MTIEKHEAAKVRVKVDTLFSRARIRAQGRWIVYGIITGIISGIGAWLFLTGLLWGKHFLLGQLAGREPVDPYGERIVHETTHTPFRPWLFFLLPAIGGLISGAIIYTWAPEAEGHGTDALVDAFHNKEGNIRTRIPYLKTIASLATLSTGGAAGREGPIAQIGGGIGSWLARKLGLSVEDRRKMMLMGTGGGLGAIFRAPLGGAVTAIEVLYREDMEISALVPTVISSFTAYVLFSSIFGYGHIFSMPAFEFTNARQVPFYLALGILIIPIGVLYVKCFYGIRDVFRKLKIPKHLKPVIGGLAVGLMGIKFPGFYSGGYGTLQMAILNKLSPDFIEALFLTVGLMFCMILGTSFTIGSGGSGGIFGPTLFIGGMLGGAVGLVGNHFWPEIVTQPGAFVVVGMASFFAGVAKAPIGSALMIMEMTGGYGLIAPLIMVSALAVTSMRRWSIYEKQVQNRLASPAHVDDYTINVLKEIKVKDIMPPGEVITVDENMSFRQVKRLVAETLQSSFPVIDKQGRLTGILSLRTIRKGIVDSDLDNLIIVRDISLPAVSVNIDDSVYDILLKLIETNLNHMPVTNGEDDKTVVGIISQDDVMRAFKEEMNKRKGSGQR